MYVRNVQSRFRQLALKHPLRNLFFSTLDLKLDLSGWPERRSSSAARSLDPLLLASPFLSSHSPNLSFFLLTFRCFGCVRTCVHVKLPPGRFERTVLFFQELGAAARDGYYTHTTTYSCPTIFRIWLNNFIYFPILGYTGTVYRNITLYRGG